MDGSRVPPRSPSEARSMTTITGPAPVLHRETRVLIVDDHEVIRAGLGRLVRLQPDLTVVGVAADGLTAVELAASGAPDVVVMDLDLPELDGVSATREILQRSPTTRVLVLTGYADQWMAQDALRAGACRCVSKADSAEDVLDAIRAVGVGT
jgi:two-component system response regulator DesR